MHRPLDLVTDEIEYPETDGKPLAENTTQLLWIVKLFTGFFGWYRHDANVFVASDLLWYPVEGEPRICTAPDVMIVLGRPKGHRSTYMQWREGAIPPQVVFEIRSPSNSDEHMAMLLEFYREHGVQEYYLYDPDRNLLEGWRRVRQRLVRIGPMHDFVSPLLGIRFDTSAAEPIIYDPSGKPFVTPDVLADDQETSRLEKDRAVQQAEQEKLRADQEKLRADEEKLRAEQEKRRADVLAAKLRELGIDADGL
jgi:Uma2 family endonuclease